MATRKYATAQDVATLAASIATLTQAVAALTPAQGKPAQAKAASPTVAPFVQFLRDRKASMVPCAIHAAGTCNRTFSPKSSGGTNHVARIV